MSPRNGRPVPPRRSLGRRGRFFPTKPAVRLQNRFRAAAFAWNRA
jgi:hypothetical protein